MSRNRMAVMLVAVLAMVGAIAQMAVSQDAPAPPATGNGNNFEQMRAQIRDRMNQRIKEGIGATDEEWKALLPLIGKVQDKQSATRMGGMGGMFGGRGGRGGQGNAQPPAPTTEVGKAAEELRKLLEDKAATVEAVKEKLGALRKARDKAKEELVAAQKELREVLTVKQEAYFVMSGLLDERSGE